MVETVVTVVEAFDHFIDFPAEGPQAQAQFMHHAFEVLAVHTENQADQ